MKQRIPNYLTFGRVALIPIAIVCMFNASWHGWLFWIFLAASLTDFLDGYLARKWNAVSPLGALLDPIADKLLVATMLLFLLLYHGDNATFAWPFDPNWGQDWFVVPTSLFLPVLLILLRELYISGLREFMASRQIPLPVSKGGKLKTAVQMLAIGMLLFPFAFEGAEWTVRGALLLWIGALIGLITAIDYTRKSIKLLLS